VSGAVVRGDYLSRMLQQRQIGWAMILAGILVAFGLGAVHAMSPGHGKTIVAAYLVGTRGTLRHAAFLGFMVTFTHTISVFLLGLGVLFFQEYIVPERVIPALGAFSGLSIVGIGAMLLYRRSKALMHLSHGHPAHHHHERDHHYHQNDHSHHDHSHQHEHSHEHGHSHSHGGHTHSQGGHSHSHVPEGKLTLAGLIALGVSGGLVPCPSALVLMLSAIALGHAGLGLVLLVGFSAGLALVLMGIGVLVIYAKHLLPNRESAAKHPFFRLVPVFSAVVVMCLGLGMTAVSLGWVRPMPLLG
jgi:ABC-type nickel/cobalt efflux system permease component RcnA